MNNKLYRLITFFLIVSCQAEQAENSRQDTYQNKNDAQNSQQESSFQLLNGSWSTDECLVHIPDENTDMNGLHVEKISFDSNKFTMVTYYFVFDQINDEFFDYDCSGRNYAATAVQEGELKIIDVQKDDGKYQITVESSNESSIFKVLDDQRFNIDLANGQKMFGKDNWKKGSEFSRDVSDLDGVYYLQLNGNILKIARENNDFIEKNIDYTQFKKL